MRFFAIFETFPLEISRISLPNNLGYIYIFRLREIIRHEQELSIQKTSGYKSRSIESFYMVIT